MSHHSTRAGQMPSGDSPELAAIRFWVNDPVRWPKRMAVGQARALLRMVDELAAEVGRLKRVIDCYDPHGPSSDLAPLIGERDELIEAARSAIPEAEHPKEETPHNWAWQIRSLGEDRLCAYKQLTACRQVLDAETKFGGKLRAKLAEAERNVRTNWELFDKERQIGTEMRERLAEAATANGRLSDGNHQLYNANERLSLEADQSRKRAEAAEARVRKLTDALFAATGGHVDLDKLEGKP